MIVTRGLGRTSRGASGIIVALGLGITITPPSDTIRGGGFSPRRVVRPDTIRPSVGVFDDIDLVGIIPIIVEVINGGR